jgi:hypothetical protein
MRIIIAGIFLATASAALAQADASACKGLDYAARKANCACDWRHVLMKGETIFPDDTKIRHIATEYCRKRRGVAKAPSPPSP